MPAANPRAPLLPLLAPRFWPLWSGLGLGWLVAQLPYRWQMRLGRGLGALLFHTARRRRHIARTNLRLCFPELDEAARERLLRSNFAALGMGVVETAMSWWTPDARLRPLARIEGLEHLRAALAQGRGVILLSAHFMTLEIGGRLLALEAPFHVLYREHKNPLFERVMRRARERHFEKAIPRDDMRGFLRSLKANMPVWYAPDQNYGREHSIFVTFFGIPAATISATHRLARISGAPVVPFFPERLADDAGYRLRLLPALADFPSGDEAADTQRINDLIEAEIRRIPEQYLWVHRRFKTRPEGEKTPY
ncbi:LpxL/LpxP family Kdo(2)-lipid IV(A) lauroyl/palmitoleoyl acyltransferase [Thiohalobacter sp. IOR34]|uniref:LpxL/LpxP family Kdo(2)-lipid IV(A) lauroyl/palmitoleoyl acyltransferase n=1 Tax=Thiohalobacter sp. IOR34 TaxID=3057176 RepID=UPI0025B23EBB|nr:LpxL/LpxP family Kdo(2)-lipid IV(A) lauroyl/palmitoleoyl acyltransferase [Thiohalobacter sp. IOR34]WJW75265.1 LpxL/LpxP family Kdo(2)-lipid IV(A) lauroyl/palmitoleoyl acyltransferase [Thiohalobacter sp. IOR34]